MIQPLGMGLPGLYLIAIQPLGMGRVQVVTMSVSQVSISFAIQPVRDGTRDGTCPSGYNVCLPGLYLIAIQPLGMGHVQVVTMSGSQVSISSRYNL